MSTQQNLRDCSRQTSVTSITFYTTALYKRKQICGNEVSEIILVACMVALNAYFFCINISLFFGDSAELSFHLGECDNNLLINKNI